MTRTIIFAIMTLAVLMTFQQTYAAPEIDDEVLVGFEKGDPKAIPDWVDQNFIWYGQGQIQQTELLNAMKFLLDNNIMFISEEAAIEVNQLREENQQLKTQIGIPPPPPPQPGVKLDPAPGALPELPGFCPEDFEPVCGEDGKTYDNKCKAEQADVEIDYRGECESCPRVYDPVCGDDGKTYGNECEAHQNGAGVEHEGECREGPVPECPRGYMWLECAMVCISLDDTGVCPEKYSWSEHLTSCIPDSTEACPDNWDPVCGEDEKTYGNECEAKQSRIEVDYQGECRDQCSSNEQCSEDLVCRDGICSPVCSIQCLVYDPVCGTDDATYGCGEEDAACHGVDVAYDGECEEILCTAHYDPMCGIDGKTYGNECEARKAQVAIEYEGECLTRTP